MSGFDDSMTDELREALWANAELEKRAVKAEAERDTLREALEEITAMHPVDSGLRGSDVARAALTRGAGE